MSAVVCVVDATPATRRVARVALQLAEALDVRLLLADPALRPPDADAEVIVMATDSRGLGLAAARAATRGPCPVLFVPPNARENILEAGGSLVCGFDGSPGAELALEVAVDLAERVGLEPLAIYADPARAHGAPGPIRIVPGDPLDQLRALASDGDVRMLAVGARGRSTSIAGVLGSVPKGLAATAAVPVLVVPATAHSARTRSAGLIAG